MRHDLTKAPEIREIEGLLQGDLDGGFRPAKVGIMQADGTHYSMTVIPVGEDYSDRFLGSPTGPGFIVINGINRQAYLFNKTGFLDPSYLKEKLGRDLTDCDMENVIHLLHAMIPTRDALPYETAEDSPE